MLSKKKLKYNIRFFGMDFPRSSYIGWKRKNIIQFPGLPSKLRETVFLGRKTTLRKLPLSELQSPQKSLNLEIQMR